MKKLVIILVVLAASIANVIGCALPTASAQSQVEIGHRQILGNTCFYTANSEGVVTALSCVKD